MGFPLGALGLPIVAVLAAIAVQAFFATVAGAFIGRRIGTALGRRASRTAGIAAGVAFLLLGSHLLVERMVLRAGSFGLKNGFFLAVTCSSHTPPAL